MRKAVVVSTLAGLILGGATWAAAQNTAQGRAFGTTLDLLGQTLVDQSDTQLQSAPKPSNSPNPSTFDVTAAGATVPLSPIAEVITGPSTTRGCSTPGGCPSLFANPGPTPLSQSLANEVFVNSIAGDATASVLIDAAPGGANVLDAVSSGSEVTVRCNNDTLGTIVPQFSGESHVDALVIAGNPVPIPGELMPNTTILAAQFPLLVLNEQTCTTTPGSATCTVNALHAQILPTVPLGLIDLKLSGSSGTITFDSTCVCNGAMLQLLKFPHILTPNGGDENPPIPNPGDRIHYVLRVSNTGCVGTGGVQIIDRLPKGVTVVQDSLPQGTTTAACPVVINGCGGGSTDTCLTIPVGNLAAGQTVDNTFDVTVNEDAGCNDNGVGFSICNVARAQSQGAGSATSPSAPAIVMCPNGEPTPSGTQTPGGGGTPGPTSTPNRTRTPNPIGTGTPGIGGGRLVTAGGGGCAIGGDTGSGGAEALPVLLLGAWLFVRRSRRSARRI